MLIASAFAFALNSLTQNGPKIKLWGYVWGQSGQLTVTLGDAAVTLESLLAYEAHFSMLSGSLWSDFGALWNHFGVSWGHFGVSLGHFGITLRWFWDPFALFGVTLGALCMYENGFGDTLGI
mgnify:CR=1 FL=1